ncbi:MAG: DUF3144 domain-containing protein [Pseudomonadota bacterium]|nr:DUF3144 domain-containing protein [Pseudomonadota bacterium]
MPGTEYELPDEFLEAADRFVTLANEMSEQHSPDWVRAVLMYAAARYNAFNWLTSDEQREQSLDAAAAYFRGEYEKMFRENMKEIEPVYRGGMTRKPQ